MGDGGSLFEIVGDNGGREGREGPPRPAEDSGDGWRRDGEGECREGDPDDRVPPLKGCTGLMFGRRIVSPAPGDDGRSCQGSKDKHTRPG